MNYFYHQTSRKYIASFAHLFSNVHVVREDLNGGVLTDIKVPIVYSGKSKVFQETKSLNIGTIVSQYLPRMGFNLTSLEYDPTRKITSINNEYRSGDQYIKYSGIPYDYVFDLSILTKNQDDMLQILEQILIRFTPDLTMNITEIPELNLKRNVSFNLDSVSLNNTTEFGELEERILSSDLTFTIKGMIYPPIKEDGSVIYNVITDYKTMTGNKPTTAEQALTLQSVEQEYDVITEEVIKTITTNV